LSLAHQQLSIVLWDMTLANGYSLPGAMGIIGTVIAFYLWYVFVLSGHCVHCSQAYRFFLTIAILCVMEGTSAMLHSLRLHWVEAMSKHFVGEGIMFQPFSFKLLLEEEPVD
jgi:V-type H+-transporting ATPase subunit a